MSVQKIVCHIIKTGVMASGSQLLTRRGTREGRDIGIGEELGNFISKEELIVFSDLLKLILEENIFFDE